MDLDPDHDLDDPAEGRITVYSGRGILSESAGPVWMIGTASEHHVIYQYNLHGAKNHYLGLIQTESVRRLSSFVSCTSLTLPQPYFQPNPAVPEPFTINSDLGDPSFPADLTSATTLRPSQSNSLASLPLPISNLNLRDNLFLLFRLPFHLTQSLSDLKRHD